MQKIRTLFAALIITGFIGMAIPTQLSAATTEDKCEHRIHNAERKLQDAVAKHGEHSHQAEKRRHELEDARAHCEHH
jgi:uncharacterized membrane protein YraQ (UPF0718 family)